MFPNDNTNQNGNTWLAVEFFAGVGGFAAAWPEIQIVAAIDIHQDAARVYAANRKCPMWTREIESMETAEIKSLEANFWWMSPPCQPYTTRGNQADVADPRARSLMRLIKAIDECRPEFIALENVCGFANSAAREHVLAELQRTGYHWQSIELCPTQMGWPNKRPRYYLLASCGRAIAAWRELPRYQVRVADLLQALTAEQVSAPELAVDADSVAKYEAAMDRCAPSLDRPTACFASSYGRTLLNSGSYLHLDDTRYRRFTPREVANLLGFPESFRLPRDIPTRTLWKLLGNSLSLPAVRYLLSHLPDGPSPKLPWSEG